MLEFLKTLDRRWIFLAMLLAVAGPILAQRSFPERPTKFVQDVFDYIENLPEGSNILFSFDYSPSSDGELAPMATALIRHCCLKRHKMFFMTLYPDGLPLIEKNIHNVIETEFASLNLTEGEDYVNLGYNNAREVAIIVMGTDFQKMYPLDNDKKSLAEMPLTENITSLSDMELIITISTGYPGMKEWVQYASSPHGIKLAVASTAVQAPQAYPYIPNQMLGILAAIKGAAEYEAALAARYPQYRNAKNTGPDPKRNDGVRRMAPQFWGHLLIIALILLGNGIYFADRLKGSAR
jgi:hypothetical protein